MHCGFATIRATGVDGIRGIKRIKIRMADDKVYGSVESDSLDRAFVSATAIAEMETRTKRELLLVLDRHEDAKVISADVVKFAPSPIYPNSVKTTVQGCNQKLLSGCCLGRWNMPSRHTIVCVCILNRDIKKNSRECCSL